MNYESGKVSDSRTNKYNQLLYFQLVNHLSYLQLTEAVARRCSITKGVFRNFAKYTRKHLCQSLFFNNVAGLRPATLLNKRFWHRCFPGNFVKFFKNIFFTEYLPATASELTRIVKRRSRNIFITPKKKTQQPQKQLPGAVL